MSFCTRSKRSKQKVKQGEDRKTAIPSTLLIMYIYILYNNYMALHEKLQEVTLNDTK